MDEHKKINSWPLICVIIYVMISTAITKLILPQSAYIVNPDNVFDRLPHDIIQTVLILPFSISYYSIVQNRQHEFKFIQKARIWLFVSILGIVFSLFSNLPFEKRYALFYYLLVVACGEEYVFRGFLYEKLRAEFSYVKSAIVSGAVYGLAHGIFQFMILQKSWVSIPSNIGSGIIGSLLFSFLLDKAGTIIFPIFTHWLMDFCGYLL